MSSKPEIIGTQILKRIHIHDQDTGGVITETTGSQGSGKTSVLLGFANYTKINHPNEKIFWSECYRAPLQIFKIGKKNFTIFVKDNVDIKFRDRNNNLQEVELDVKRFTDFDDLFNKASSSKINVVFFGNRFIWMNFIDYLRGRGKWCHVFIDEMAEICPSYMSGNMWKTIRAFSTNILKDMRKDFINIHYNTQKKDGIDDSVRKQVMVKIYLPGAIKDKHSRIEQRAIDNLEIDLKYGNQAYLEYSGRFGVVRFEEIFKPNHVFHIDAICNGGGGEIDFIPSFTVPYLKSGMKDET